MSWSPDNVGEDIVFSVCPSVRPFIHPDRSCCYDISWTSWTISMKLTGNIH